MHGGPNVGTSTQKEKINMSKHIVHSLERLMVITTMACKHPVPRSMINGWDHLKPNTNPWRRVCWSLQKWVPSTPVLLNLLITFLLPYRVQVYGKKNESFMTIIVAGGSVKELWLTNEQWGWWAAKMLGTSLNQPFANFLKWWSTSVQLGQEQRNMWQTWYQSH